MKEKVDTFKIRNIKMEDSMVAKLRSIMGNFGFVELSPFVRWVLIKFMKENKQ
jgi:uncharacterized protein YggT (Ycf19 family)